MAIKVVDRQEELTKSTNLENSVGVSEPKATENEVVNGLNESENTQETETQAEERATESESVAKSASNIHHLVEYIGNGVWIDSKGVHWARNIENTDMTSNKDFSDEDFASREDIQFMIQYGAMKHTTIEI